MPCCGRIVRRSWREGEAEEERIRKQKDGRVADGLLRPRAAPDPGQGSEIRDPGALAALLGAMPPPPAPPPAVDAPPSWR
eukprot:gene20216-45797_t